MPTKFSIHGPTSYPGPLGNMDYKQLIGKDGRTWLVGNTHNAADHIYADGGKGSEGFGGRTLEFDIDDGSTLSLIGPWKSNSDHLFAETGHDVRHLHLSMGIISLHQEPFNYHTGFYINVLHRDHGFEIGPFDRIEQLALGYAAAYRHPTYFAVRTLGGGMARHIEMTEELVMLPNVPVPGTSSMH